MPAGPGCGGDRNGQQLIDLGAENAFVKMLIGRAKHARSGKCCNAAYLYALYGAIHDIDWREIPDRKKEEFQRLTAEMRASGQFS